MSSLARSGTTAFGRSSVRTLGVDGRRRADVVIVGARCAGAALATWLARAGFDVVMIDRARFPSDTLSTHLLHVDAVASLQRLGVLGAVQDAGAPAITRLVATLEGIDVGGPFVRRPGDPPGAYCVRRPCLDQILVDAATTAGVEAMTDTRAVDVLTSGGRARGVVVERNGCELVVEARLVVGADGRASTVAKLVGARRYNTTTTERFAYWAYFEGAATEEPVALRFHRQGEDIFLGFPCDGGLYIGVVLPPLGRWDDFRADLARSFSATLARCGPLSSLLAGAQQASRPIGTRHLDAFFREACGPGWVLVGDAGHFKDPILAQGMGDAYRQAERLAAAVADAGLDDQARLDRALVRWWRWRDREASAMYRLAEELSRVRRPTAFEVALLSALPPDARHRIVAEPLATRRSYLAAVGPRSFAAAGYAAARRADVGTRMAMHQAAARAAAELSWRWRRLRPRYERPDGP